MKLNSRRLAVPFCSLKKHPFTPEVQQQTLSVEPFRADIIDPAKFNGSSGSREQDADREPASAATAAGHLESSLSAAALKFLKLC